MNSPQEIPKKKYNLPEQYIRRKKAPAEESAPLSPVSPVFKEIVQEPVKKVVKRRTKKDVAPVESEQFQEAVKAVVEPEPVKKAPVKRAVKDKTDEGSSKINPVASLEKKTCVSCKLSKPMTSFKKAGVYRRRNCNDCDGVIKEVKKNLKYSG